MPQPSVRRRTGRRLLGLGAAAGLAVAALLTAPVAVAAPEQPGTGAIGPGVQIATPVGGGAELCTANFLYAADDTRYLGTAAHCMAGAEAMSSVDGCAEPVLPEGTEVRIAGRDGRDYAGTTAYNSWAVMQERGETDRDLCLFNDFALVELGPDAAAAADPTVPGLGGPTALDTDGTRDGETVYSHQPNQLPATPNKRGVSLGQPESPRSHVVLTAPSGVPGDSGAGYLDGDGRAFGVLSSLLLPTSANGVTDIAAALDYAAEHGRIGRVDLVPGTAPFSPFSPSAPLTALPDRATLPGAPLPDLLPAPLR